MNSPYPPLDYREIVVPANGNERVTVGNLGNFTIYTAEAELKASFNGATPIPVNKAMSITFSKEDKVNSINFINEQAVPISLRIYYGQARVQDNALRIIDSPTFRKEVPTNFERVFSSAISTPASALFPGSTDTAFLKIWNAGANPLTLLTAAGHEFDELAPGESKDIETAGELWGIASSGSTLVRVTRFFF